MPTLSIETTTQRKVKGYDLLHSELTHLLRLANVTEKEIAEKIGLSPAQYHRGKTGEDHLKPKHLIAAFKVIVEKYNYLEVDICRTKKNARKQC